jgi:hypothetical protein
MKLRVLVRKRHNRRVFVVQFLDIKDEWASLREFDGMAETGAHLRKYDKVTDEYSIT